MPYDEELVERVRGVLAGKRDVLFIIEAFSSDLPRLKESIRRSNVGKPCVVSNSVIVDSQYKYRFCANLLPTSRAYL